MPVKPGLTVYITFGPGLPRDTAMTMAAWHATPSAIASHGMNYDGPSSPWWYSPRDLHQLMQQVTPIDTTVARLCRDLGFDTG